MEQLIGKTKENGRLFLNLLTAAAVEAGTSNCYKKGMGHDYKEG